MDKKRFGLIGRNISYSFSRNYFNDKFKTLNLKDHEYVNYDLEDINDLRNELQRDQAILRGLNVTIPYKEEIIPFLDEIDAEALNIGAVNTIKILPGNKLKGYNTDAYGFEKALKSIWRGSEKRALILGTGGASKAIAHVLHKTGIEFLYVSRKKGNDFTITYDDLDMDIITAHELIINCSPVGTFPNVEDCPKLPYEYLTEKHLLFDLIYNPEKTTFMKMGEKAGSLVINGYSMLVYQAEKAWEIWNS
ncbi:shikimate dehydrogenase family protein [Lutimonas saemankumensis]|uniref:shikimate dehydrogenase family protein n=1 Tax=Lutimonas saemankumensis TaxID=483016 RepID=UPI00293D7F8D|nr:shikimate dehydrogenase [Lutimonas saemankumensis]